MRILIAEDDAITRRLLEATLGNDDYEIEMYCDGETACQALQKDDAPALVILDWMMSGMDGIDICRQLRARDKQASRYLLLLIAKEQQRDVFAGLEAGADDYVVKPFSPLELKARLHTGVRTVRLHRKLIEARNAMQEMLKHDLLTGLWNHSAIVEMLEIEAVRAKRSGESIGLVIVDIDHFKQINDTFGHPLGDQVLREAAKRIKEVNRGYDTVGRYSGDAFIILLPGCDEQQAQGFAGRLQARFSGAALEVGGDHIEVSLSMGIAAFKPGIRMDVTVLIHQADQALSRAKSQGSARIACASSMAPE